MILSRSTILRLLPSLILLALLVITEGVVRLVAPQTRFLDFLVTHPHQRQGFTDTQSVSVFEGDPLLFWRLKPNLCNVAWDFTFLSTNADGIRYPHRIGPKRPSSVRVLCAGDSVTFGYRVPVAFARSVIPPNLHERPYPMLLEAWLRQANPDREIEVIPLAVPGYTSHQGLLWLRRDLRVLEPDILTACFGWNDINTRPMTDRQAMPSGRAYVVSRNIVRHSQAMMGAIQLFRRLVPAAQPASTIHRVPADQFVSNFLDMASLAKRQRIPFIVVGAVYRDRSTNPGEAELMTIHRNALRMAMARAAIPYIEIAELTENGHPANNDLFGELIHPNAQGHKVIARRVWSMLHARRMLPNLVMPEAPFE